jgi:hypothetical protein
MTTITIDIPDPLAAVLAEKAKAQGMTLEDWFRQVAAKEATPAPSAPPGDFKEWERKFDAWINAPRPKAPVLSDEAMSRESIYPDRG